MVDDAMQVATHDVGQLSLRHKVLSLSSHQFLLEDRQSCATRLLQLQLLDLVGNLILVLAAGLYALLGVSNSLEIGARIVKSMSICVLLLAHFT